MENMIFSLVIFNMFFLLVLFQILRNLKWEFLEKKIKNSTLHYNFEFEVMFQKYFSSIHIKQIV